MLKYLSLVLMRTASDQKLDDEKAWKHDLPVMFLSSMFHWMRGGLVVGSRARLALHPEYGTRTISTMS